MMPFHLSTLGGIHETVTEVGDFTWTDTLLGDASGATGIEVHQS